MSPEETSSPNAGTTDAAGPAPPRFARDLDTLIRARYPLLYLVSWEEQRLDVVLEGLAQQHGKAFYAWSITQGLHKLDGARFLPGQEGTKDPVEALQKVAKLSDPSLVVFKDFHPFLNDPIVVRSLRELAHQLKATFTTLILLSPTLQIPVELDKEITVLDVPLPTFQDLWQLLREIVGVVRRNNRAQVELTKAEGEQIVKAALGLTMSEAENAFAKAIATDNRLDVADVALILEEKRQIIRKSGLLEYFPAEQRLADVGGLESLKEWLRARGTAFGEEARRFGLPAPKGLLLLGVQGCGKSLTAKAVAAQWDLPLLRLDIGRIFSSLVGSSEENLRRAIQVAEGISPVVLWIDEIEKALSGVASSGSTDSGVTARVFGSLITWLQEKTAPVFVIATANRVASLPPELLRKGRFDEIFFVDLPAPEERAEILRIHLARRRRDPGRFDIAELVRLTDRFSGGEIEQAVIDGLYLAFAEHRDLEMTHLARAIQGTLPLSTTMREEIERLREWALTHTRPASRPIAGGPQGSIQSRFG